MEQIVSVEKPRTVAVEYVPPPRPEPLPFEQDKEALMAFFEATNGPGWVKKTNWGNSSDPNWYVVLATNGVIGSIPTAATSG